MQEPILPPDETTHSFVIRVWQETPGQQRGTIRHVQSEARMAFTRLDQAVRWMERTAEGEQTTPAVQPPSRTPVTPVRSWWTSLLRYQHTPALAMAGMVAVLLIVVVWTAPDMANSLPGTATGEGLTTNSLLPFLAGLLIGGLLVTLWMRSTPGR